jgi:NitT/TauT family transport system substrate-binding protein
MRLPTLLAAAILAPALLAVPTQADEARIRVGYGFGIAFLPHMIVADQKLLEKHGREQTGAPVAAEFTRFSGSAAMQDAVLSGNIDWGGYGIPALLLARQKTRGTPNEVIGLTGFSTAPLVLLTNRAAVKGLKDFGADDRIAMPALVSPQMYVLQAASERAFGPGRFDELKSRVVALPHPDALAALRTGTQVTGYFASAPFIQIALKDPKIHAVLDSSEVMGKLSFLVNATSRRFAEKNPKLIAASIAALEEATRLIQEKPAEAARIYLAAEPSQTIGAELVEAIIRDPAQSGFGVAVHGVRAYGELMVKLKQLKEAPASWQEVFPLLKASEGS